MSLYDYRVSQAISAEDPSFAALIMAAFRKADTDNSMKLRKAFPEILEELKARYKAPGGLLPGDIE